MARKYFVDLHERVEVAYRTAKEALLNYEIDVFDSIGERTHFKQLGVFATAEQAAACAASARLDCTDLGWSGGRHVFGFDLVVITEYDAEEDETDRGYMEFIDVDCRIADPDPAFLNFCGEDEEDEDAD